VSDAPKVVNTYPQVPAGELRVGDVRPPYPDYRGDDPTAGAVYESAEQINGPHMMIRWRYLATGETVTGYLHATETVRLLRRGPE
jgi:hypothetical protein